MTHNQDYWQTREVREFDVHGFLQGVHDKYAGTEHEVAMEALQNQWNRTLAMPACGDPKVCPYIPGTPRFALMEVWHKAGDFWRAGYRDGDRLLCDQDGHALHGWMLDAIGAKPEQEPATVTVAAEQLSFDFA